MKPSTSLIIGGAFGFGMCLIVLGRYELVGPAGKFGVVYRLDRFTGETLRCVDGCPTDKFVNRLEDARSELKFAEAALASCHVRAREACELIADGSDPCTDSGPLNELENLLDGFDRAAE